MAFTPRTPSRLPLRQPADYWNALTLKLASPERILAWSHGEVTKPETINYRTQRSEKHGLFDEKIFGPEEGARVLASRPPRPDLAADPNLPDDTRLWALLQQVGGGTWGGCVYDVDAIAAALAPKSL